MLRWLKRVILPLSAALLLIRAFRPARTNPPVDPMQEIHANLAVDPAVAGVFARSCNDCHSNRTVWPWYSHVAPASWLVISDVNRGRKSLNFSEWSTYRAEERRKQLGEICKEVTEGEMPGFAYTIIHREAKLSTAEVGAVCRWAQTSGQEFSAAKER